MVKFWILLSLPLVAFGSETVFFSGSPAADCYRAAVDGGSEAAIETCTTAIEKQVLKRSDLGATFSNRGLLRVRAGEVALAIADHNKAVELLPEIASIHINLSNALVAAKRFDDALAELEEAIVIADRSLPVAYYNRALMLQSLGDNAAARADAERAAELAPETLAYRRFVRELQP